MSLFFKVPTTMLFMVMAALVPATTFADIYVAGAPGTLLVFDNEDDGNVEPRRVIAGPNTGLVFLASVFVYEDEVFITNVIAPDERQIVVFPVDASGDVTPSRVLETGQSGGNIAISNGEIFSADETNSAINVYSTADSGVVAPLRSISGANTSIDNPVSVSVAGNEIVVLDNDDEELLVFGINAAGNVTPLRTISGASTGLLSPWGVDVSGDEIYVTNDNGILVFPLSGNGDIPPSRSITGANTTLPGTEPEDPFIFAGEIYAPAYLFSPAVTVFDTSDSGDIAPKRRIAGPNTQLVNALTFDIFVTAASPAPAPTPGPTEIPTTPPWLLWLLALSLTGMVGFSRLRKERTRSGL